MKFREWFQMMTLGHPGQYMRLMAWCLFDSIVMSVPYGLMLGAVYFLLVPLAEPGVALPTGALWGACRWIFGPVDCLLFYPAENLHRCLHWLCGNYQGFPNHTGRTSAPVVYGLLL